MEQIADGRLQPGVVEGGGGDQHLVPVPFDVPAVALYGTKYKIGHGLYGINKLKLNHEPYVNIPPGILEQTKLI